MSHPSLSQLTSQDPCVSLKGVGPVVAKKLSRIHIHTIEDLWFHLPNQYQDRTQIVPMNRLQAGAWVVIEGAVLKAQMMYGKRRSLHCMLGDNDGQITMVLFHFNQSIQRRLGSDGMRVRCFGQVQWGRRGYQMIHPEYQIFSDTQVLPLSQVLTPIYPVTDGLSQLMIRKCIDQALRVMHQHPEAVDDLIPDTWLKKKNYPPLWQAIQTLHQPSKKQDIHLLLKGKSLSHQRLIVEELAAHQMALLKKRQQVGALVVKQVPAIHQYQSTFYRQLPFVLTGAQQRVISEISGDLLAAQPMMRLLQGDVGSGKTVVAAMAMLLIVDRGQRAVLMAPTELLAEQHYDTLCQWFEPLGVAVGLLTGKLSVKTKQSRQQEIANNQYDVVVGTHALFQKGVVLQDLALIVVDEQHRFGVDQRLALWKKGLDKGYCPHQLIMTATPIPRTLSMLSYADLSCSVIDELPSGRQPIQTVVMSQKKRDTVLERVYQHCQQQQCFWVCPLIDESELIQCQAAETVFATFKAKWPGLPMGLLHGRMPADDKSKIMAQFKNKQIAILVATTVVEVGVDVPDATLMVIDNAERLGLSQLHQLRGRVGRGSSKSHCVLLYQPPLSRLGRDRLDLLRQTQDGFLIAEKDLIWRGPGELMGTRQTGAYQFQVADLLRDADCLDLARDLACYLLQHCPHNVTKLTARWVSHKAHYMMV